MRISPSSCRAGSARSCLLAVCAVYLRKQSLGWGGALLSLCGLALLGFAYWQAGAAERAAPDLASRLDAIGAALARLEAQLDEVVERQAELAAALDSPAPLPTATSQGESATVHAQDGDAPASPTFELEVRGGLTDAELAAILAWVREIKAEHRSARISIVPVLPLQSADPDGARARLMGAAGQVIDHVFAALSQRVDIGSLVSEDVPAPTLRLGFSEA